VALDRTESRLRLPGASSLPEDAREALLRGRFAPWFRALTGSDSLVTPEDFVDEGWVELKGRRAGNDDSAPMGVASRKWRALERSPGGLWILDPVPKFRVTDSGRILGLEGGGIRLTRTRSPKDAWDWDLPEQQVEIAEWLDKSRILLAGWSRVEHPRLDSGRWMQFQVPTIWILDLDRGEFRRFQGAPLAPGSLERAQAACRLAREATYPDLPWER
jgi:hypothetical protein